MRPRTLTIAIVGIGIVTLIALATGNLRLTRQVIKTCFTDAKGLRPGAPVQIAGVDVGAVRSVQATGRAGCPAEVVMDLTTPYELKVPHDATTHIHVPTVPAQPLVEIDLGQASGPPIEKFGYLKSR